MDVRNLIRPIIAGLIGLGLIILVVVIIMKAFGGGTPAKPLVDLGKYQDTTASATYLIDDPTNIDQDHRQVKITVSGTQNEIDIIQGYQGTVISSKTYPNNSVAFGVFLQSLKLMNYAKGDNSSALQDYRGFCPGGQRYNYSFNDGQKTLFNYWSTSCGQGTFKGNRSAVRSLFDRQIPEHDFDSLTGGITLGSSSSL